MNELEVRMRVHALVKNMVHNFMASNNVSATVMVDALNDVLVELYPMVQSEMLQALDEANFKAQQEQQNPTQELKATPKKKEDK